MHVDPVWLRRAARGHRPLHVTCPVMAVRPPAEKAVPFDRVYVGEAVHKGTAYPGEHQPSSAAPFGTRSTPFCRTAPEARGKYARANAGAAERSDLRPDRLRHVADTHA